MMRSCESECKLILVSAILKCTSVIAASNTYNVMNFGAIGNGIADDTKAMQMTWSNTCNSVGKSAAMIIPQGKTFVMYSTIFAGPCKPAKIDIVGCMALAPTVLRFLDCKFVQVNQVTIRNSSQGHILAMGGSNFVFGYLDVQAPGESPNTDGIHLRAVQDVLIYKSNIASGDDCVPIGDGIFGINVTDINCGPGHGVSIGSLGRGGTVVNAKNITVTRVNFTGTTNGARIKTWMDGRGEVQGIVFSNLIFKDVENPIIIDQHYGDVKSAVRGSGVYISNVHYTWATGTSKTAIAINLNCSSNVPCTDIFMDQIQLTSTTPKTKLVSSCNYAHGKGGLVEPRSGLVP